MISSRRWLWIALLVSIAMLAAAQAFQRFGGFEPCHLCILQRRVYWAVVGVCVVGLVDRKSAWSGRVLLAVLGALFLIGAGIAIQQAGAEWKFWAAPEGCSGARAATAEDLARLLSNKPMKTPRCDEAAWRMLGLSMAGWNALVSLAMAAVTGLVASRKA